MEKEREMRETWRASRHLKNCALHSTRLRHEKEEERGGEEWDRMREEEEERRRMRGVGEDEGVGKEDDEE